MVGDSPLPIRFIPTTSDVVFQHRLTYFIVSATPFHELHLFHLTCHFTVPYCPAFTIARGTFSRKLASASWSYPCFRHLPSASSLLSKSLPSIRPTLPSVWTEHRRHGRRKRPRRYLPQVGGARWLRLKREAKEKRNAAGCRNPEVLVWGSLGKWMKDAKRNLGVSNSRDPRKSMGEVTPW